MSLENYSPEIQELFLRFLTTDPDLFARCQHITKSDYFDPKYRKLVDFLNEHTVNHNAIPTRDQITAVTGIDLEPVENITEDHQNWFLGEFEQFCRHKALERAIVDSTDLLEKQNYGEVENMIKAAVQIGLVKDLGLEYFENPKERLEFIKNQRGAISTGWKAIDEKLYGGLNRGEVTIFAGGSGAGKSLWLQNFALNWAFAGLNVVYISLELSEQLISMRLDAMASGYTTRDVMKNIDDVDLKIRTIAKQKKAGKLRVKQMPNGITANDIRAFLREYEIQNGIKVDALLVDYLDLMMPISNRVSASDLFIKDKYVTEELRNLVAERDLLCVTASQLNRAAVEELEFDHSHIAGGLSKIQTADNVVGIFTSNAMRERGRYQIQFMKTRSSSGVGSKVDFAFDQNTLRITDLNEDDEDAITAQTSGLLNQLKRNGTVKSTEPDTKDVVEQGLNLAEFLKSRR